MGLRHGGEDRLPDATAQIRSYDCHGSRRPAEADSGTAFAQLLKEDMETRVGFRRCCLRFQFCPAGHGSGLGSTAMFCNFGTL
jgi:hypothetical protein